VSTRTQQRRPRQAIGSARLGGPRLCARGYRKAGRGDQAVRSGGRRLAATHARPYSAGGRSVAARRQAAL